MIKVYGYLDGSEIEVPVNFWKFPGGELGVKISGNHMLDFFVITITGIPTSEDIIYLMNTLDSLKRIGVPASCISISMKYFPYARQDRVCHEGESFALKVFVDILSTNMHYREMVVCDLHSSVMLENEEFNKEFVSKLYIVDQEVILRSCVNVENYDSLIAPDAGAAKKISSSRFPNVITLSKVRQNGTVVYENLPEGSICGKVLVVDDICDGGATFVSLAEMLERTGNRPDQLDLFVTHGIFSKGVDTLYKKYDNVFTANLMNPDLSVGLNTKVIQ